MTNPGGGQSRRRAWASDTVIITGAVFGLVLIATVVVDMTNGPASPPAYLTGLLGASSMAFFTAAGAERNKRDRDMAIDTKVAAETADRAEAKADTLAEFARYQHPDDHAAMDQPPITDQGGGP